MAIRPRRYAAMPLTVTVSTTAPDAPVTPPDLSTLPGLVAWLDGRQQTYSDAGGTAATSALAGRVKRINSPSVGPTNTSPWLVTGSGSAVRDAIAIDQRRGEASYIAAPSGTSIPKDSFTMGIALRDMGNVGLYFADGTGTLWITNIGAGPSMAIQRNGAYVTLTPDLVTVLQNALSLIVTCDGTTVKMAAMVNGVRYNTTGSCTTLGGSWTNLSVASNAGGSILMQAEISQAFFCNQPINEAQITAALAFMESQKPSIPTGAPLITIIGDSIGKGASATADNGFAYLAQAALNASAGPPRMFNPSVIGRTIQQCIDEYAAVNAPNYSSSRTKDIVVVQVLTNSMPNRATATVLAEYWALCDLAKAQGRTVVACTCLPRTDGGKGATFAADWATVNAAITSGWAAHAAALCDWTTISGMGLITDPAGANWSGDGLHPSDAGHVKMATKLAAVISPLL